MIIAEDMHATRFCFTDAVIDREVCQIFWQIDQGDKEMRSLKADEILDWCEERCKAFQVFATELCIDFFSKDCGV